MHGWENTTGSKVSHQVPAEKGLRTFRRWASVPAPSLLENSYIALFLESLRPSPPPQPLKVFEILYSPCFLFISSTSTVCSPKPKSHRQKTLCFTITHTARCRVDMCASPLRAVPWTWRTLINVIIVATPFPIL